MDALQYVQTNLRSTDKSLREIADGAGVGQSWLRMFARGEIPDPGYSKVKALADYFMHGPAMPATAAVDPRATPPHEAAA